jgi:hypothetical protein
MINDETWKLERLPLRNPFHCRNHLKEKEKNHELSGD